MNGATDERPWAVILAGGDGRRCRDYWKRRYSDGRPKQFCSLDGPQSLIEQTLHRVRFLSPQGQTIVVVCRKHLRWRHVWEGVPGGDELKVCVQPKNSDTGPAVLLAALMVERQSPGACLAVFPSDHHVTDSLRFMAVVREAAIWTRLEPDNVILLGAEATYPETEYGWLDTEDKARSAEYRPRPARLVEKPDRRRAERLLDEGAWWNTSVLVCRASVLVRMMEVFATDWWRALDRIDLSGDGDVSDANYLLDAVYASLPPFNLSRDVLERWPRNLRALPMTGTGWCDLGSAERIRYLRDHLSRCQSRPGPPHRVSNERTEAAVEP